MPSIPSLISMQRGCHSRFHVIIFHPVDIKSECTAAYHRLHQSKGASLSKSKNEKRVVVAQQNCQGSIDNAVQ